MERAVWRWGDCALKATRPWHKQSNIKYHPNSRKFKYSKIPIVLIIIKNFCVRHICTNRWGFSKKWMFTRKWTREQIWGKWTKPETRPTKPELGTRENWNLEQNAFLNVLPLCNIIYVLWRICCRKKDKWIPSQISNIYALSKIA